MPRPKMAEDPRELDLSPERAFVAAMLRAAVSDARSQARGPGPQLRRANARAWLRDRATVMWWLDLIGLPDWTYDALLREAGLED